MIKECDKHVLLAGAGGDIGLATAGALAGAGFSLHCMVRDQNEAGRLRARIGTDQDIIEVELSDADAVPARVAPLLEKLGSLRAVINCTGVAPFGPVATAPLDRLRNAMEINVYSSLALFQLCMPILARSNGRFVMTSSASGFFAVPFLGYYAATKRALESLADSMRMEARPKGVDVVLIQPGRVSTRMGRQQLAAIDQEYDALPDDQRAEYGFLYRGFSRNSRESEENGDGIPALEVGKAILDAVIVAHPQPRYRVGADADRMWEARRTLCDRSLDDTLMSRFSKI